MSEVELFNRLVTILIGASDTDNATTHIVKASDCNVEVETSLLRGPLDGAGYSTTFELRTCDGIKTWLPIRHDVVSIY